MLGIVAGVALSFRPHHEVALEYQDSFQGFTIQITMHVIIVLA